MKQSSTILSLSLDFFIVMWQSVMTTEYTSRVNSPSIDLSTSNLDAGMAAYADRWIYRAPPSYLIQKQEAIRMKYKGGALYIHRPAYAAIPASILLVDRIIEGEFTREVYSVAIIDCHMTIIKSNDSDRIVDDCFIYDR